MRARIDNIRQVCESNKHLFAGSNISGGDVEFQAGKFIPRELTMAEGITWCQIPKAGTHAWGALFLLLRGLGVQQIKVKSFIYSRFGISIIEGYWSRRHSHGSLLLSTPP